MGSIFKIQFKGFDVELKNFEIKSRKDLHPDWFEFRFEAPEPMEGKHVFIMPTKFRFGPYLFEVLENEPATNGWFLAKKIIE